ncbi:MAG: fibrobacter succinogenes major paralogous domain-containing protein [Bacteroidales bacterium]
MKTIVTIILAIFLIGNLATAQDTLYIYKSGSVVTKRAISDIDSVIFYKALNPVTVTDIDDNVYHTVTIGTQVWMVENLKTTKYNDGTSIPLVSDGTAWSNLAIPGYCFYNNDAANKSTYGALYNWFTVNTNKLAPTGWHVPTDAEWTTLENYLIANGFNYDGTTTGNKIAKSMAATSIWSTSINTGTIGHDLTKNNSSGFTGFPGGFRTFNGAFGDVSYGGYWWSSTESSAGNAWIRILYYYDSNVYRLDNGEKYGFSVRCLQNY